MVSWFSSKRHKIRSTLQDTYHTAEDEDSDDIAPKRSRISRLFHFRRGSTNADSLEDDTDSGEDQDPLNRSAGWYTGESDQSSIENKVSMIQRLLEVGNEARSLSQASSRRRSTSGTLPSLPIDTQYSSKTSTSAERVRNPRSYINNPTRSSLRQPTASFPYWDDEANGRRESGLRQSYSRTRSSPNSIYQTGDQSPEYATSPPRSQSRSRQERRRRLPLDTEGDTLPKQPRYSRRQDRSSRRSFGRSRTGHQSRLAFNDNVGVRMIDGLSEKERIRNRKRNEEKQAKAKRNARREGY